MVVKGVVPGTALSGLHAFPIYPPTTGIVMATLLKLRVLSLEQ